MEVGVVGYFNKTSGYGFIESDSVVGDVFFHMNEVGNEDPTEGQKVLFEYEHAEKGPRATALSLTADDGAANGGGDETRNSANATDAMTDDGQTRRGESQGLSPLLAIPSHTSRSVRGSDSQLPENQLEVGDLAYLKLFYDGESLGIQHPFRGSFTLLIGSGDCPALEAEILGETIGTSGYFEVSITDGTVRAPPLSIDEIDLDPPWLADLAKEAGAETVHAFVEMPGEKLVEGGLLNTDQLAEIQTEVRSSIENYELIKYKIVEAARWRDLPEGNQSEGE